MQLLLMLLLVLLLLTMLLLSHVVYAEWEAAVTSQVQNQEPAESR